VSVELCYNAARIVYNENIKMVTCPSVSLSVPSIDGGFAAELGLQLSLDSCSRPASLLLSRASFAAHVMRAA